MRHDHIKTSIQRTLCDCSGDRGRDRWGSWPIIGCIPDPRRVRPSRHFFGVYAAVSSIASVLLAGVIGGTIALPVFGTMFGPWLLVVTFVQAPVLLLPVTVALWAFHISYQRYRDERETIFQV